MRTLLIRPDFLPSARCNELIVAFQQLDQAPPAIGGIRRLLTRTEIAGQAFKLAASREVVDVLDTVRQQALDAVHQFYRVRDPCYIEYTLLTEMRPGDAHPLHADNETRDSDGQWIPNHTPWRDYTAMLYLNTSGTDYQGGVLRFPVLGQEIVPQSGQLIGFTCGREHQHEVTPIQRGSRYSISVWMTRRSRRAEDWD